MQHVQHVQHEAVLTPRHPGQNWSSRQDGRRLGNLSWPPAPAWSQCRLPSESGGAARAAGLQVIPPT